MLAAVACRRSVRALIASRRHTTIISVVPPPYAGRYGETDTRVEGRMKVDVAGRATRVRLSGMSSTVECDLRMAKQAAADHMKHLADRAAELCKLEAGWDNAEAPAVNRKALDHAMTLVAGITCPECLRPDITPTRSGNVLLSWTYGPDHIEIEAAPNADLEILVELPGNHREFVTSAPHDQILGLLAHWVTAVGVSRFDRSL